MKGREASEGTAGGGIETGERTYIEYTPHPSSSPSRVSPPTQRDERRLAGIPLWEVCISLGRRARKDRARDAPLYHKNPSPYLTFPTPHSTKSNTHIHRPTSCKTRLAYFLFNSSFSAVSAGMPKFCGWTGTVSYESRKCYP
jgi:hypothetical protein